MEQWKCRVLIGMVFIEFKKESGPAKSVAVFYVRLYLFCQLKLLYDSTSLLLTDRFIKYSVSFPDVCV